MEQHSPLLQVNELSVGFSRYGKGFSKTLLPVIHRLSLSVNRGEILAVVGSSGAGKSLLAHAILGLLPGNAAVEGSIAYGGTPLDAAAQRRLRGKEIAFIPQTVAALDPLLKAGAQVQNGDKSPGMNRRREEAFARLGLADGVKNLYPFALSGGMARRVLFASAAVSEASLILADEPTPGMGAGQAVQALSIFQQFAGEGKAVVLITHDVDLALAFAHRIAIFYAGTIVEETPVQHFAAGPAALRHPYSKALWQAMPQHGFTPLPGFQPYAGELPRGCPFAPRCGCKSSLCGSEFPPARALRGGLVRCHHAT